MRDIEATVKFTARSLDCDRHNLFAAEYLFTQLHEICYFLIANANSDNSIAC